MKEYASGKPVKKDVSNELLKPYRVSIEELAKKKNEYQILRYPYFFLELTCQSSRWNDGYCGD